MIVFTDWMGRSPQEIEDQITYPLSRQSARTGRRQGGAIVERIQFLDDQHHLRGQRRLLFCPERVPERLTLASTFLAAGRRAVSGPRRHGAGPDFWYTVEGQGTDLGRLRAIQDWYVRYQLNSVPGVAQVASVGGYPIEYQIDVDPNKLRAYGVTLGELYSAVARSNSAVGGRVIQKGMPNIWCAASAGSTNEATTSKNIVIKTKRPRARRSRRESGDGQPGHAVPPQRAGEKRQRSRRRRGA